MALESIGWNPVLGLWIPGPLFLWVGDGLVLGTQVACLISAKVTSAPIGALSVPLVPY